jgi:rhamnulokinase
MLKVLAFDYGASSGRAILGFYDGNKLNLEEVHRFSNDPVMLNNTFYWDLLRLFYEMKQGILKCMHKGEKDLAAIGIDTWGVDFGLLDEKGQLLGNPVHYRDERTEGMIEKAWEVVPKKDIYEETGIQFMKFNTIYQLLSMKHADSPILKKAKTMLLMPDLLNYFLTGKKVTEYTIASTTQMLNPKEGKWAKSLLEKLGIPVEILTDIIDTGTVVGEIRKNVRQELDISNVPVVAVAGHDTGSAVISVPASQEKFAYISSGTWSLMGVELTNPIINETTFSLDYTNEGGYNRTTRLLKNIMGLWILQECKRTWDMEKEVYSYDELEEMAEGTKPFLSFIDPDNDIFYGPGNMPGKIQEYCKKTGQEVPEGKAAIVRCILESLALKYRITFEGLEEIVGYKIPVLHIVGGGALNKVLCQFTANALGKTVITGPVEATSAGNLLCQLMALGEVSGLNEARELVRRSFTTKVYEPKAKSSWEEALVKFEKTIKK